MKKSMDNKKYVKFFDQIQGIYGHPFSYFKISDDHKQNFYLGGNFEKREFLTDGFEKVNNGIHSIEAYTYILEKVYIKDPTGEMKTQYSIFLNYKVNFKKLSEVISNEFNDFSNDEDVAVS